MQLRCRTHAVQAWPLLTFSSSSHLDLYFILKHHIQSAGGVQHKSCALAQGGWHFKYGNNKEIKSLVNQSLRLLTTTVTLLVVFLLLICV